MNEATRARLDAMRDRIQCSAWRQRRTRLRGEMRDRNRDALMDLLVQARAERIDRTRQVSAWNARMHPARVIR